MKETDGKWYIAEFRDSKQVIDSLTGNLLGNIFERELKQYVNRLYKYPPDERIFPIVAEAVQHKMRRHIEKSGVKKIRVHDLRHSHVAYLIHQGVEPLMIKQRLGHKDIKITLNTYGHLYPNEQKKLAEMLTTKKYSRIYLAVLYYR